MDNDTRYEPFLCGSPHTTFATPTVFSDYRSTCPYQ
jgi:triacylglycerol lipase